RRRGVRAEDGWEMGEVVVRSRHGSGPQWARRCAAAKIGRRRHERGVGSEPIRRDFRLLPEASSTPPCLLAMDHPSASALRLGPLSPLLLGLLLLAGSGCDSQPCKFHPLAVVITSPSGDTLVPARDFRVQGLVYGGPDHYAS